MNELNHTIESTLQTTGRSNDRPEDASQLADQIIQAIESDQPEIPPEGSALAGDGSITESLHQISHDVDQFARGWIGRVRKLLQRSSQLVEREAMLAGAIAKLNQQQSDWNRKTNDKDAEIKEHSARLTEAWLEVEAARRKAIQGARAAATSGKLPPRSGVVAGPIVPVSSDGTHTPAVVNQAAVPHAAAMGVSVDEMDLHASEPEAGQPTNQILPHPVVPQPVMPSQASTQPVPIQSAPQAVLPAAVPLGPPASLPQPPTANRSGSHGQRVPTDPSNTDPEQAQQLADAVKQKRIEEFQRMQRALRSNQNK